jgi:sulfatase maturation enzyme AslB (radical SAM superfamily)
MLPLFAKYQTKTGNRYVYDVCTGEILRVGDVVYRVLDDYHLLTPDEICEKYLALGKETVREALAQLDEVQEEGLLCDHAPEISAKVESLCCEGKREPIRDFLLNRRRLLTLELTQQCNLACEYCVYGKHYDQTRQPSDAPMSLDTAKSAVTRFLSHKPETATIGFYGGEPLLEFELMKDVVAFAEPLAAPSGVELRFNMTTNGTLLSEEKIHYLVTHEFNVMISLDGNKQSHDRYRVFKSAGRAEQRRGSFDVVIGNMERFVQLYPDYQSRGIVLTLTANADLLETEQFLRRWKPLFPVFVSNVVLPVRGHWEGTEGGHWIETGECHTLACSDESCVRTHPHHERLGESPEFADWSKGRSTTIGVGLGNLVSKLRQSDDASTTQQVCDDSPICRDLLRADIEHIHRRPVVGSAARKLRVTRLSCFPGAARTYCSSQGVIFPCERVDFGKLFEIGDATSDVDVDKACDFLIERVRLGCDCGNCIISQVCTLCPAQITESQASPGYPDFLALRGTCGQLASEPAFVARLRNYTEIMEVNPRVLDWLYPEKTGEQEDWLGDVTVLTAKQEDVELTVEELKEVG